MLRPLNNEDPRFHVMFYINWIENNADPLWRLYAKILFCSSSFNSSYIVGGDYRYNIVVFSMSSELCLFLFISKGPTTPGPLTTIVSTNLVIK